MKKLITKLQYVTYFQCERKFFFYHNKRKDIYKPSLSSQILMKQSKEVEELARKLYPDGQYADLEGSLELAAKRTKELINTGCETIFEATFFHENRVIKIDILNKKDNQTWEMIEVKATSTPEWFSFVKDGNETATVKSYMQDVAIQSWVLNQLNIKHIPHIMCINTQYKRDNSLDLKRLFTKFNLEKNINKYTIQVEDTLEKMNDINDDPKTMIGSHCKNPYPCPFAETCWKNISEDSIYNIPRITSGKGTKIDALKKSGVKKIEDFKNKPEALELLTDIQKKSVVQVLKNKAGVKNTMKMKIFLNKLKYPYQFMDFETFSPMIPLFENTKPMQYIPFQYSLHIQEKDGTLIHKEFLHKEKSDPRRSFIENLLKDLRGEGSIMVYNRNFEERILDLIVEQFPEYEEEIKYIKMRILDLMEPFKKDYYYHPKMLFSNSLKYVSPALVPEIQYKGLAISDGEEAMFTFEKIMKGELSENLEEIYQDLLNYCKLDTLSLVEILKVLKGERKIIV